MEGDIEEHGISNVRGSQQAKKGDKGDRHGVEGRVEETRSAWAVTTVPPARMSARSWLRDIKNNDVVAITD